MTTYRCEPWKRISVPGKGTEATRWFQHRICSAGDMRRVVSDVGRARGGPGFLARVVFEDDRRSEFAMHEVFHKVGYRSVDEAKRAADAAVRRFMCARS